MPARISLTETEADAKTVFRCGPRTTISVSGKLCCKDVNGLKNKELKPQVLLPPKRTVTKPAVTRPTLSRDSRPKDKKAIEASIQARRAFKTSLTRNDSKPIAKLSTRVTANTKKPKPIVLHDDKRAIRAIQLATTLKTKKNVVVTKDLTKSIAEIKSAVQIDTNAITIPKTVYFDGGFGCYFRNIFAVENLVGGSWRNYISVVPDTNIVTLGNAGGTVQIAGTLNFSGTVPYVTATSTNTLSNKTIDTSCTIMTGLTWTDAGAQTFSNKTFNNTGNKFGYNDAYHYIELSAGSPYAYIDFHNNSTYARDYDARIIISQATVNSDGASDMTINAASLNTPSISSSGSITVGTSGPILSKHTGTYSNLNIAGTAAGGYRGVTINSSKSFMSNDSEFGIFDNTNNKWSIYCLPNAGVNLNYNGSMKISSTNTGATITGALSCTSASMTGTLSSGALTCSSASVSGALTSASASTGAFACTSASIGSDFTKGYIEIGGSTGVSLIDFHANSVNANDYDARLVCWGNSAGIGGADLHVYAAAFRVNGALSATSTVTSTGYICPRIMYANPWTGTISNATSYILIATFTPISNCFTIRANCNITFASGSDLDKVGVGFRTSYTAPTYYSWATRHHPELNNYETHSLSLFQYFQPGTAYTIGQSTNVYLTFNMTNMNDTAQLDVYNVIISQNEM